MRRSARPLSTRRTRRWTVVSPWTEVSWVTRARTMRPASRVRAGRSGGADSAHPAGIDPATRRTMETAARNMIPRRNPLVEIRNAGPVAFGEGALLGLLGRGIAVHGHALVGAPVEVVEPEDVPVLVR